MKNILTILLLLCFGISYAQQLPAPDQSESILIINATAHIGNGKVIKNSAIGFDNGKINYVGEASGVTQSDYKKVIDATGKEVYPGFIAPNTQMGLKEIDAVRSTRDNWEVGLFNPHIRSIIAYNTDSRVTPTIRSTGVLLGEIVPQGGFIAGTSSVVELDAWNWEDAAYSIDMGVHLRWPNKFSGGGWWAEPAPMKENERYAKHVTSITDFLKETKAYTETTPKTKNLKFEAMKGVFDGSKKLFIHVDYAPSIMESVQLMEEMGIKPVIVGGDDSWRITDFLKKKDISIVLSNVQRLPSATDEDIDQPFKTASMLQDAGVNFCFSIGGAWEQRTLLFQAGQAAAFGLDYEAAISGLTLNTAKILGIDKRVGSLEMGKDATLIVCEGDVLDMRTSKLTEAFIRGKSIDLDNKQEALYRKYKKKYED